MNNSQYPTVRLRPKDPARAIRFGAPWVFADTLVMDRRTRAIPPGSMVVLEDAERATLGLGAFNAGSKIAVRLMDTDPAAVIDQAWLTARLARALSLREHLFDAPFYRLVHAEADGLPGVIIDRFGDTLVIQPNAAWAEAMISDLAAVAIQMTGAANVYKNASGRARALDGLDETSLLLSGAVDGPIDQSTRPLTPPFSASKNQRRKQLASLARHSKLSPSSVEKESTLSRSHTTSSIANFRRPHIPSGEISTNCSRAFVRRSRNESLHFQARITQEV